MSPTGPAPTMTISADRSFIDEKPAWDYPKVDCSARGRAGGAEGPSFQTLPDRAGARNYRQPPGLPPSTRAHSDKLANKALPEGSDGTQPAPPCLRPRTREREG